jgi:predicted ABC-type transport system involved in lysophospholipase L1 biosynthesis ATPase subunit
MDVKGARELLERLAQRQWVLTPSVQRGEQPREDPDLQDLESIGDDYRVYAFPANGDGGEGRRVKKVLVDGHWRPDDAGDVDAHAAA